MTKRLTEQTPINEPVEKVWDAYTNPKHIVKWNFASDDWRCPKAKNDLRVGGRFNTRMEAKDGSVGFDFSGTYTAIVPYKKIAYTMDGEGKRAVTVEFEEFGPSTLAIVTFDLETENPIDMQRAGWQAILENFKKHVETTP